MSANFTPEMDDYKEIKKGPLFIRFVLENFPLLTEDFDAMTYDGALCKLVDYMKKLIDNETALENNMTALYDAYNQLQDYVNHYFDNLDVQDEINTKLAGKKNKKLCPACNTANEKDSVYCTRCGNRFEETNE